MVFVERLENQIQLFSYIPFTGKFGGATGNFNAHHVAYPKTNWVKFANDFLENKLGLQRQQAIQFDLGLGVQLLFCQLGDKVMALPPPGKSGHRGQGHEG